ncbi:MAG: hypothetical protein JOZ07_10140 [Solirubrobacterales bacterium]|nr:hypothetical protein [Solirubrobacterales bacterium]
MAERGDRGYAFVFRAYPDVDHMAPLAWKLLEDGEVVHALISPGYDPRGDYRLAFLSGYPRFHLHETAPAPARDSPGARASARARRLIRGSLPWAMGFIARRRVGLVAVEWGYGLRAGYERIGSPRGVLDVLRSIGGSVAHRGEPGQLRTNLIVAARLLHRPIVCLPHGLSVKLGRGSANGDLLPGPLDWRDRNRFSVYVLNTEHHRRWFIQTAAADPDVMQAWGSLRWAPEWFELNRRLAPPFRWPSTPDDAPLRVVYMVPKWVNHVDREAALALVKRLQAVDEISLAVKAHPRPEGSADPLRDDPEIDWTRLHDVGSVDSVSLIGAADVVIDVGSSIGLEVLMQRKVLVNPTYIHDYHTLFDEVTGSCVIAHDADEVVAYVRRHAAGRPTPAADGAYDEVLRHAVYAARTEPYDVVGTYLRRVRELVQAPS